MTEVQQVLVPDIGDLHDVPVIEVLVSVGDSVTKDQGLVTLESDKATLEVPSTLNGVVKELAVRVGDTVSQGSVVAFIASQTPGATASPQNNTSDHLRTPQRLPAVVPDLGDVSALPVIEVLVKVGQEVTQDQGLVVLESDKTTIEVPSSVSGIVDELLVKEGDRLASGQTVAMITLKVAPGTQQAPSAPIDHQGSSDEAVQVAEQGAVNQADVTPAKPASSPAPTKMSESKITDLPYASPAVRLLARECGIDLRQVNGSGRNGRITRQDVENASLAQEQPSSNSNNLRQPTRSEGGGASSFDLLPWPNVDFAKFGAVEIKPLSRIKKLSGANLARNWVMIPHVTQFDQADVTDLEALRVQINREQSASGVKLTLLAFLMKASVAALQAFPEMNSSLDPTGQQLILKKYYHIGFAADTEQGLVVLVVRDVDRKGVIDLSKEIASLAKQARDGKLSAADTTGGCFTISSLGGIGGTQFTPIINAPEVAILGVSRSSMQPVWDGQSFVPKLMLPLALSYDHRVIDGAQAARFTKHLRQLLTDVRRLIL